MFKKEKGINAIQKIKEKPISRNKNNDQINHNLSELKLKYNQELLNYKAISKEIINIEIKIEKITKKINKIQYLKFNLKHEINKVFINNINENQEIISKEIKDLILFCFGFEYPEDELIYFENENELIEYFDTTKFHLENLRKKNKTLYEKTKKEIINSSENNDFKLFELKKLFYIIKIIFDEIEIEEEKNELFKQHIKLTEGKNSSFINLKNLEKEKIKIKNHNSTSSKNINKKNINKLSQNKEILQDLIKNLNTNSFDKEIDLNLSIKSEFDKLSISSISNNSKILIKQENKNNIPEEIELLKVINDISNNKNISFNKTLISSQKEESSFPPYDPTKNIIQRKKNKTNKIIKISDKEKDADCCYSCI